MVPLRAADGLWPEQTFASWICISHFSHACNQVVPSILVDAVCAGSWQRPGARCSSVSGQCTTLVSRDFVMGFAKTGGGGESWTIRDARGSLWLISGAPITASGPKTTRFAPQRQVIGSLWKADCGINVLIACIRVGTWGGRWVDRDRHAFVNYCCEITCSVAALCASGHQWCKTEVPWTMCVWRSSRVASVYCAKKMTSVVLSVIQ